jgi:alpha-D-xyloside xylohydrolase
LIRWFQFAAFSPVMRIHGVNRPGEKFEINGQTGSTGAPNEVWSFGEEAFEILSHYLNIRERLRPYIQKHMDIASKDGTPVMRPLFYDFPDDRKSYTIEDQYMFGPDILVAPVLEAGADSRKIYLPEGSTWMDALTGETYEGGRTIDFPVSIEHIPVFTRNGFSLGCHTSHQRIVSSSQKGATFTHEQRGNAKCGTQVAPKLGFLFSSFEFDFLR